MLNRLSLGNNQIMQERRNTYRSFSSAASAASYVKSVTWTRQGETEQARRRVRTSDVSHRSRGSCQCGLFASVQQSSPEEALYSKVLGSNPSTDQFKLSHDRIYEKNPAMLASSLKSISGKLDVHSPTQPAAGGSLAPALDHVVTTGQPASRSFHDHQHSPEVTTQHEKRQL
eukprot:g22809.t1